MSKYSRPSSKKLIKINYRLVALLACLIILSLIYEVFSFYQTHFLPGTYIQNHNLSHLTTKQALTLLDGTAQIDPQTTLTLAANNYLISSDSAQLDFHYDYPSTLEKTLKYQRQLPFWRVLLRFARPLTRTNFSPLSYDEESFQAFLTQASLAINQEGHYPSVSLKKNTPTIDPGQDEIIFNREQTANLILASFPQETTFSAILDITPLTLTDSQISDLEQKTQRLIGTKINFTTDLVENYHFTLTGDDLAPLLLPDTPTASLSASQIIEDIRATIDRPLQEPELIIDEATMTVTSFKPPQDGLALNETTLMQTIFSALENLSTTDTESLDIPLPLATASPTKSLADINNLGINEVIGFGESYYAHSISGRVHNVAVAASHINNTLVAPGEEFSFNKVVGDVSSATGYLNGYVIKNGRSELSAGGGVCQVSTTLFRALLDSGLQITLRKPHSYRVSYYELNNDPGFDATVYTGNVDLRFINDTDHYVLITATTDSDALYMYVKIYGTSDGRTTTITDYRKFNASGAPAPQYIPDPSLPPGVVKQIDWAVGGLQTDFTHTIYNADGSIRSQKNYPSTYHPWSAKYLVGP
ncbi:VanW family protein [bacterium]|nr:VanW family protein [bacterium]